MTMITERAAVKKGALLLDKILPGWHRQVNLDELQMSSGAQCMLGQLFGHSTEAALARKMYPKEMKQAEQQISAYGYAKATWPIFQQGRTQNLLQKLMNKFGLLADVKWITRYQALQHVCGGHDNKCIWAEEVAARLAKEEPVKLEVKQDVKTKTPRANPSRRRS